jgi:hypothetical protein
MPALNYARRFAADVKSGKKRQTIRAIRKRPFRIGDTLYHWVDQRQPTRQSLGTHKCRMAVDIKIWPLMCSVGKRNLWGSEAEELAIADGFDSFDDMAQWFDKVYGLPFCGQLIMW